MSGLSTFLTNGRKLWPSQLLKDGVLTTRMLWLGIIGVLLIAAGSLFDSQNIKPIPETASDSLKSSPIVNTRSYEESLEGKLANILSQVKGAGTVTVNITLENGSTQEHAKNIVRESKVIQEKDTSGGVRTTTETKENEQILLSKENGVDKPVMVREIKPVIKGVLVIAEGAYDSTVKVNLTKAVEAGLGVPSYKITILPQRK
ncbi:MAG: hypothetical protein ABFC84_07340 [Veillonellales bacterium]